MEPVIYKRLDAQDFELEQDEKDEKDNKQILKCKVSGLVSVFFFTNDCTFCETAKPILYKISNSPMPLALVNLTLNSELINMSKNSNIQLTYVPRLIIFQNGYPVSEFTKEFSIENLKAFLSSKQQSDVEITGVPLSKNVCYLDYESAYKKS
jgi:thiol-disulfide isomerase/thioredoxin